MQFLTILRPSANVQSEAFGALQVAEEQEVWRLYTSGILRAAHWSGTPADIANIRIVFTMEADVQGMIDAAIDGLPMVKAGLLVREVIPLSPWRALEVLFANTEAREHEE